MGSRFQSVLALAACLTLSLLVSGCGGGVKPRGKVTNEGKPLTVSDKGLFVMSFILDGNSGKAYEVDTKRDGTFTVPGPDGHGIPPGKYRISVEQFDPYPTTDLLMGKFKGPKSPIVRDVSGSGSLDIDLSKPQG